MPARTHRASDYSGTEISFRRARDRYEPFALPMSFELQESAQLEGEIGPPGNGRGEETRLASGRKRRCVIGDADAGKRNT